MRAIWVIGGFVAVLAVSPANASSGRLKYWVMAMEPDAPRDEDGTPACSETPSDVRTLQEVVAGMERSSGSRCELVDEGANFLVACGSRGPRMVFPTLEACRQFKEELPPEAQARQIAFQGCLNQEKRSRGIDAAVARCRTVASKRGGAHLLGGGWFRIEGDRFMAALPGRVTYREARQRGQGTELFVASWMSEAEGARYGLVYYDLPGGDGEPDGAAICAAERDALLSKNDGVLVREAPLRMRTAGRRGGRPGMLMEAELRRLNVEAVVRCFLEKKRVYKLACTVPRGASAKTCETFGREFILKN